MNRGDTDGKKIKKPSECDRKGESGWRNEIENSRRGGGWERDERERDVRGGGSLSSDWLPPLARSRVLRLAAAPERSHTREGGGGATTQPELSPIHTDSSPPHETRCWFCSWKTKIDVLFYFFCMHAWIMLHWVAGADRVSPPRFYSQKKEKVTTAQRLFGTFWERIRGEFAPGLLLAEVSCEEYVVFYVSCWVLCCLCAPETRCFSKKKCAQVVERAHFLSPSKEDRLYMNRPLTWCFVTPFLNVIARIK